MTDRWPVFLAYREADGSQLAEWLYRHLQGHPVLGEDVLAEDALGSTQSRPRLDVFLSRMNPAAGNWQQFDQSALEKSVAMILICTPGAARRMEANDRLHDEISWWTKHRKVSPILVALSESGHRWVPRIVEDRWPNTVLVTISVNPQGEPDVDETWGEGSQAIDRIIQAISQYRREGESLELERLRRRWARSLFVTVLSTGIWAVIAVALYYVSQQAVSRQKVLSSALKEMSVRVSQAEARAERESQRAQAARLAFQSRSVLSRDGRLALLLAAESVKAGLVDRGVFVRETEHALRDALAQTGGTALRGPGLVEGFSFSPRGRWLFPRGSDGSGKLWDLSLPDAGVGPVGLWGDQGEPVIKVFFSPDEKWLVTLDAAGKGGLRDLRGASGTNRLSALPIDGNRLAEITISPDGRWVAVVEQVGEARLPDRNAKVIRLWRLREGGLAGRPVVLDRHNRGVEAVAFRADGKVMASGDEGGTVLLWTVSDDGPAGDPERLGPAGEPVLGLVFDPAGRWLLALSVPGSAGALTLWDLRVREGPKTATPLTHQLPAITGLSHRFSRDGRWLMVSASGSPLLNVPIHLWDLSTRGPVPSLRKIETAGPARAAEFSPDGDQVVTADESGAVRLWDLGGGDPRPSRRVLEPLRSAATTVAYSPDRRWLTAGGLDGSVHLWRTSGPEQDSHPARSLLGQHGPIEALAVSPDSRFLVTGSSGDLRIWDLLDPTPAQDPVVLHGAPERADHAPAVSSLDGKWVVTSEFGRSILWRYRPGPRPARPFDRIVLAERARYHEFSPRSRWLLTSVRAAAAAGMTPAEAADAGSPDGALLWDLSLPDPRVRPRHVEGLPVSGGVISFSPDDRWLITVQSETKALQLWDLQKTPSPSRALQVDGRGGEPGRRPSWKFSRDGRWLAVGDSDGHVALWRLDPKLSPVRVPKIPVLDQTIRWFDFSPDSRRFVLASRAMPHEAGQKPSESAFLLDLSAGEPVEPVALEAGNPPLFLAGAFSGDGQWLAIPYVPGRSREPASTPVIGLWDLLEANRVARPVLTTPLSSGVDPGVGLDPIRIRPRIVPRFSPDSRWLLTDGARIGTARLFDLRAKDLEAASRVLPDHRSGTGDVEVADFSPDGRWLVSSGRADSPVRLWRLAPTFDERPEVLFGSPGGSASRLFESPPLFSADGHFLAVFGRDIRLLNLTAEDPTAASVLADAPEPMYERGFTSDQRRLVVCGQDATVWALKIDELLDAARVATGRNMSWNEWKQFFPEATYHKTFAVYPVDESVIEGLLDEAGNIPAQERERRVSAYREINRLALETKDPLLCESVCRRGSLAGAAGEVREAGRFAASYAPSDPKGREALGLALALIGEFRDASAEFRAALGALKKPERRPLLESWVEKLTRGQNPFDPETLKKLRDESGASGGRAGIVPASEQPDRRRGAK